MIGYLWNLQITTHYLKFLNDALENPKILFKALLLYMVSNYFRCPFVSLYTSFFLYLFLFLQILMLCRMQASIPKGDLTLNGGMFQQPPFSLPPLSKTQVKLWWFFLKFHKISSKRERVYNKIFSLNFHICAKFHTKNMVDIHIEFLSK